MQKYFYSAVLLAAVLFGLAPATHAAEPRNLAVIIGVQTYTYDLPPLNYCAKDATSIATTLEQRCGYKAGNIKALYTGGKRSFSPSKVNITAALTNTLLKDAGVEDTVLVYFSGHGLIDKTTGTAYLATVECDRDDLAGSAIAMQDITDLMNQCKAKRKFLLLDCCHAAAIHGAKDAADGAFNQPLPKIFAAAKGFATLASCQAEETSREYDDMKQGLFTHFVIQGLQSAADKNDDGVIEMAELYSYVHANVSQTAHSKMGGHRQNPTLHLAGTTGTLALATYQRATKEVVGPAIVRDSFRQFPAPMLTEDVAKRKPRAPLDEAKLAFQALRGGALRSVDDPEVKLLISVAENLRTPDRSFVDPLGEPLNLANPYFEMDWANNVYEWLKLAKENYEKANKELPQSLRISLALAAWYGEKPDPALAREMIDGLGTAEQIESMKGIDAVKAQLLLVKAHTRNQVEEKPAALRTYLRVLDQVKENERNNKRLPQWNVISDAVLEPARFAALDLSNHKSGEAPNQRDIARTYGEYADLIRRSQVMTESDRGIEYYTKAVELDPKEPSYRIGLIALQLFSCKDGYTHEQAIAQLTKLEEAANSSADSGARGLYYGTRGLAFHEQSRTVLKAGRVEMLKKAISDYNRSIRSYADLESQSKLRIRDQLEYAYAYQNRGVAQVELANLENFDPRNPAPRMAVLTAAAADGVRAQQLDPNRGHECYLTVGNAYEDLAWLPGGNASNYVLAQKTFEEAVEKFPMQAKCYTALGRCLYKQNKHVAAEERLRHSLALSKSPEAHCFLARIMIQRGQISDALEHLAAGVAMYDSTEDAACARVNNNLQNRQNKLELVRYSAAQCLKLLSKRANGAAAIGQEPSNQELIDRLTMDAEVLGKLNPVDRVIVQAETNRLTALLLANAAKAANGAGDERDLLDKASKQLQLGWNKLQAARKLLDDFTDEDKVRLLIESVSYTIQSPSIRAADFRLDNPQSILDARKAVSIAAQLESSRENKLLVAQANGWAGTAVFLFSLPKNANETANLQDEAEKYLQSALKPLEGESLASAESSSGWRWAQGLGLLNRHRLKRLARGAPAYQTAWNASYEHFKKAFEQCDDASEKADIREQWNEVYRLK